MNIENILKAQIETIVKLTDEEFHFVLGYFEPKNYKKNQFVVQAGSPAPLDHFVAKGLLRSYFMDEDGKEHITQFAMEDWWISDPQAYHNRLNATLNIDCLENTQALAISIDNREKLCAEFKKMEFFFMKKTTAGYIALQKRILSLMSQNSEDRYRLFEELYPELMNRIPKKMIASYLGVSRETLSRLSI